MMGRARGRLSSARAGWLLALAVLTGCARLDIHSIGLHETVVKGGVAELDAGHVVDYTPLRGVGADIWLAGHHTTHGAVFAHLDDVRVGDPISLYGRVYHVVAIIRRPDRSFPGYLGPLVLQTSQPVGVLLVVAA